MEHPSSIARASKLRTASRPDPRPLQGRDIAPADLAAASARFDSLAVDLIKVLVSRSDQPANKPAPRPPAIPVLYRWLGVAFLIFIMAIWYGFGWPLVAGVILAFFVGWYRGLRTGIFTTMDWWYNRDKIQADALTQMDALWEERTKRPAPRSVYEETMAEIERARADGIE